MRTPSEYALYYDDTFLELGTLKEISSKTDKSVQTLMNYRTKKYQSETRGKEYVVIKIEEDEEYEFKSDRKNKEK